LVANFSESVARVGYRRIGPGAQLPATAAGACGLSVWHRFFGWLCGRPLLLLRVDFSGETPEHPQRYETLFGCPVYYRQQQDLLYFDSASLAWPLVHTEHSLREFLRTAPYQLLVMDSVPDGNNLSAQVKAMIGYDFSDGFPGFEAISAALNVSAPTLRRRLKKEGTTFQRIKDEARCEAAKLCLERPELTISDIALQLGFSDPSAFHRSFRKWTGSTPGQFRLQRRRGSGPE
jgi:AraC-like DNA-binding protein